MTFSSLNSSVGSNRFMKSQGFKNKLKILLGGVCCILYIFISIISVPIYLFRIVVILIAKVFRPDLGDILNGLSSHIGNDYFYNNNSPRTSIIVSLVIHGRDLSQQELKEMLLERWIRAENKCTGKLTFQQFQQYPVRWMGFTFWKNAMDIFNINNHVFLEEQKDTDGVVDDEELNNIYEKLMNAPYPPNRSPWEVHLIKNYKSGQLSLPNNNSEGQTTFVILFKVHHCLADGYGILNALVEGFGQHSLKEVKLPVPTYPKRNIWERVTFYFTFPFNAFYEFSYVLSQMFHSSPWKVTDSKKEWYQFCAKSDFIPIQKLKFIKTKLHVSFTSVLLSAISSAICQSINREKQNKLLREPEGVFKNDDDDCSMYILSVLPLPDHSNRLTNHYTVALFDLPTDIYESSKDRLYAVDNLLESAKNTCIPSCIPLYNSAIGCNFYSVGKFLGTQRMVAAALTNFPSVPIKIERSGMQCIAADSMVGSLDGVQGVAIMVLSYGEYIRVAVTAEKAVMTKDEVNRFVKNVTNEIDQLYKSC